MLKRKKTAVFIAVLMLCFGLFTGCGSVTDSKNVMDNKSDIESKVTENEKINIVCTIFPEYDWVKEIIKGLEDRYELTLLLDGGVDLHSYQPTAEDIAKISTCDVLIYVGGTSDAWVEEALIEAMNKDIKVIQLLDLLGDNAKEEELKEGMEEEDEGDHAHEDLDHNDNDQADDNHELEYDEHVWLSFNNAALYVSTIVDTLIQIDGENAETIQKNSEAYKKELEALNEEYINVVAGSNQNTLIFGDRFPFRYMVEDYGLDYYAAFLGCSAETEASFETIVFLSGKMDEIGVGSIITIDNSNQKLAQTIINNTLEQNQQIRVLNSMQSVTKEEIKEGKTYLSIMKSNLEVLKTALE